MARVDEKSTCLLVEIQLQGGGERGQEAGSYSLTPGTGGSERLPGAEKWRTPTEH